MGVQTQWVRYGAGRVHSAYLAMPDRAQGPLPAAVVVQEVWGVDGHIEDITRRLALAGYAALAPDLFSKDNVRAPGLTRERINELQTFANSLPLAVWSDQAARASELGKLDEPRRSRIEETRKLAFGAAGNFSGYLPSLLAAASFLRETHEPTRGQKVVSVGFCMGGGLSALLACHDPKLAAAAIYYGSAPPAELIPAIQCPLIGFYGANDKNFSDPVPALAEAMRAAGKQYEPHVYPATGHAFFNDTRPSYAVAAARDAWARTLELFRRSVD